MKLRVTVPSGQEHTIEGVAGWTLMECIVKAGLPMKAECGGACACATCHVYVDPVFAAQLPPRKPEEGDMLDLAFEVNETSRLSCQIELTPALDGLSVRIAPEV